MAQLLMYVFDRHLEGVGSILKKKKIYILLLMLLLYYVKLGLGPILIGAVWLFEHSL